MSNHKEEIEPEIRSITFDIVLDKQEVISSHIMSEEHLDKIKNFSFMRNIMKEVLSLYDNAEIKSLVDGSMEDLQSSKILYNESIYRNSVVLSYYSILLLEHCC